MKKKCKYQHASKIFYDTKQTANDNKPEIITIILNVLIVKGVVSRELRCLYVFRKQCICKQNTISFLSKRKITFSLVTLCKCISKTTKTLITF